LMRMLFTNGRATRRTTECQIFVTPRIVIE
jgi:hypothetical protein